MQINYWFCSCLHVLWLGLFLVLVEELICCFATGTRVFKKIFGSEMPWHQHKELPELVGQDTVLTAGNEGTQLCNVLQLSSLHRTASFFPHLFFLAHITAGPGMLWDVGEEGAGVMPRKALQEGMYGMSVPSPLSFKI